MFACFVMRLPPISTLTDTLSPYTTLYRSYDRLDVPDGGGAAVQGPPSAGDCQSDALCGAVRMDFRRLLDRRVRFLRAAVQARQIFDLGDRRRRHATGARTQHRDPRADLQ